MTTAHDALAVIDRTLGWLSRDPAHLETARYTEATLGRWIAATEAADDSLADLCADARAALSGFDAEPAARAERVARLTSLMDAVRGRIGPIAPAAVAVRAQLLPLGVADERPLPPVPPPPPVVDPIPLTEPTSFRDDGGYAEPGRDDRSEPPSRPARGERRDSGGGAGRGERSERAEGSGRAERADRTERPEGAGRPERGDRPQGRERSGRGRQSARATAEAETAEADARALADAERRDSERRDAERRAPPPPPEPRTFPLGHPDGTGVSIESLGVLDAGEVAALTAAGINTVADLLTRAPVAIVRAGERLVPDAIGPGPVLARGKVSRRVTRLLPIGKMYELRLTNERHAVTCRWPGDPPPDVRGFASGVEVGVAGRVELEDNGPVIISGEVLGIDGRGGDWFPRYGIDGIADEAVRTAVRAALRIHADAIMDHLPPELLERFKLLALSPALRDVHFPSNVTRKGRSRMVFDELLQVQLGTALSRRGAGRDRGVQNPVNHGLVARAMAIENWSFTDAQEAAFDDIRRDLRRNQAMARLLQGEPGSGTDLVIRASMLTVAATQHQALYLAPDALTAEHRFLFSEQLFKAAGVEPVLLNGNSARSVLEAIKKGETLIAYGTHALLKELPAFRKLGLVVVEEHGGSYGASAALEDVPSRPDLLVFTPTPVATAIALTVYGHLAVTALGRGPGAGATARVIAASERETAYVAAREALEGRQQVMLVFPVVKNQDLLSPSEARRLSEVLATDHFPGVRIGIFNGGMSREERFRAYDDFAHRRTDLLLATSFLEHGPPVPDASVLIVEHAHMIDLTRLHRLRGHVAGGFRVGQCFLVVPDEAADAERTRLDVFVGEPDGYQIAEHDLAARGLEAFLGDGVDAVPVFSWADPVQDRELLLRTRAEAVRLLQFDPGLRRRAHRALLALVRHRVGEEVGGDASEAPPGGSERAASQGDNAGAGANKDAGGRGRRRRRRR